MYAGSDSGRGHAEPRRPDDPSYGFRSKVRLSLEAFIDDVQEDERGVLSFVYGSALVHVLPAGSGDRGMITLVCITNEDVPASSSLDRYVAGWAERITFGAPTVIRTSDGHANIAMRWTMVAGHIHNQDLQDAVNLFAGESEKVRADVRATFGGSAVVSEKAPG
jgi:hypothetical protein